MGEAKNRRKNMTPQQILAEEVSKRLANEGRLIEAGWVGLKILWVPENAPEGQVNDMRKAFMAGAQHLFSSIMVIMDDDREPTEADFQKMNLISKELEKFAEEVKFEVAKPEGTA